MSRGGWLAGCYLSLFGGAFAASGDLHLQGLFDSVDEVRIVATRAVLEIRDRAWLVINFLSQLRLGELRVAARLRVGGLDGGREPARG